MAKGYGIGFFSVRWRRGLADVWARRITSAEGRAGTRSIYEGGSMRRSQNITFCFTSIKIMSENKFLADPTIKIDDISKHWNLYLAQETVYSKVVDNFAGQWRV